MSAFGLSAQHTPATGTEDSSQRHTTLLDLVIHFQERFIDFYHPSNKVTEQQVIDTEDDLRRSLDDAETASASAIPFTSAQVKEHLERVAPDIIRARLPDHTFRHVYIVRNLEDYHAALDLMEISNS